MKDKFEVYVVSGNVSVCPWCGAPKVSHLEKYSLVNCNSCYRVYDADPRTGKNWMSYEEYAERERKAGKKPNVRGRHPNSLANLNKSFRRKRTEFKELDNEAGQ